MTPPATYVQRRGEIAECFDRTAVDDWRRLTSSAPVGRIRATVRAGRDRSPDIQPVRSDRLELVRP